MSAKAAIEIRLESRQMAEQVRRPLGGCARAVGADNASALASAKRDVEISKRPPSAADLKRRGRFMDKESSQVSTLRFLMTGPVAMSLLVALWRGWGAAVEDGGCGWESPSTPWERYERILSRSGLQPLARPGITAAV